VIYFYRLEHRNLPEEWFTKELSRESVEKIRDVLSSMLGSAVKYGFLAKNSADGLHVTPAKRGTRRQALHFDRAVHMLGTNPRTGNLSCGIPDSRPQ
jgi:hypothetical protein